MKILCAFGKYAYGDPTRGLGYEYVNFIPALTSLGHEVRFFDVWDRSQYEDFTELNRSFLEVVDKEKPDIVFCVVMGYELWLETLSLIKNKTNSIMINWSTDDSWKYEQFSRYVSPLFDLYVTTYKSAYIKSQRDGFENFILSQWAANHEHLMLPKMAEACKYKISFIGAAYGNRRKWVRLLSKKGYAVECFGHGWENGVIGEDELANIINDSIISLNFADSGLMFQGILPFRSRQIKARIFEVLGYGGFLVTEPATGLGEYYCSGKDLLTFKNLDELLQILKRYLHEYHERDEIANNGHRKTAEMHTYQNRFKAMLAAAEECISRKNEGVSNNFIDFDEFEMVAKRHRVGLLSKILKYLLLGLCMVCFGRARGSRAARRVLFELSWRLAGSVTYSARGLPGRLFYKES